MVELVLEAARPLQPDPLVVVSSPESAEASRGSTSPFRSARSGPTTVRTASQAVGDADEVLVLSGDTPLLTSELLTALVDAHRRSGAAATVLSFVPDDIRSYGRVVRDEADDVVAIVEAADASPRSSRSARRTRSIYVFRGDALWPALDGSRPRTRRASCISPTPSAASSPPADASGVRRPIPTRPRVSTRAQS